MLRSINLSGNARVLAFPFLLSLAYAAPSLAAKSYAQVSVEEPYLELHTGPGRGYPVFHVVERGMTIQVLKRRTDWFKVRTPDRREGWVSRAQMLNTLQPTGEITTFKDGSRDEFTDHRWEMGMLGGDFGGARILSGYGSFSLTNSLAVEAGASHIMGRFSNSYMATAALTHVFFPEWRVSPFVTLGTGLIQVKPKATLVQTEPRTDQIGFVGAGLRAYLARRFMVRLEYKSDVVFTTRDDNDEVSAWQGGFAFFF